MVEGLVYARLWIPSPALWEKRERRENMVNGKKYNKMGIIEHRVLFIDASGLDLLIKRCSDSLL